MSNENGRARGKYAARSLSLTDEILLDQTEAIIETIQKGGGQPVTIPTSSQLNLQSIRDDVMYVRELSTLTCNAVDSLFYPILGCLFVLVCILVVIVVGVFG